MESKGFLKGVSKDWMTGNTLVTFELDRGLIELFRQLEAIQNRPLRITAKQWREKRSLDANAYYWVLLSRLAEALHISKPRAHNLMLRKYGQDDLYDGQVVFIVIPDTVEAEETALEEETFHIRPTSQVVTDKEGKPLRTYIMRKGSSRYDTAEMSHLIYGLVSECREMGIETVTPDELKHMLDLYEQNRRRRNGKEDEKRSYG